MSPYKKEILHRFKGQINFIHGQYHICLKEIFNKIILSGNNPSYVPLDLVMIYVSYRNPTSVPTSELLKVLGRNPKIEYLANVSFCSIVQSLPPLAL